jgi:hypothetical protein
MARVSNMVTHRANRLLAALEPEDLGSAQGLCNKPRRHYQPKTAFPLQLRLCMRF